MWCDVADHHRWCSVDWRRLLGEVCVMLVKSHLGLIIIRALTRLLLLVWQLLLYYTKIRQARTVITELQQDYSDIMAVWLLWSLPYDVTGVCMYTTCLTRYVLPWLYLLRNFSVRLCCMSLGGGSCWTPPSSNICWYICLCCCFCSRCCCTRRRCR